MACVLMWLQFADAAACAQCGACAVLLCSAARAGALMDASAVNVRASSNFTAGTASLLGEILVSVYDASSQPRRSIVSLKSNNSSSKCIACAMRLLRPQPQPRERSACTAPRRHTPHPLRSILKQIKLRRLLQDGLRAATWKF